jgi:hypothetical protein
MNDLPRASIYEVISPDLLHQLIKGTFKDHLVDWITKYIGRKAPGAPGRAILDDIDWRYGLFHTYCKDSHSPFSGLQQHHHSLAFGGFLKVEASNNGLVTIQRH